MNVSIISFPTNTDLEGERKNTPEFTAEKANFPAKRLHPAGSGVFTCYSFANIVIKNFFYRCLPTQNVPGTKSIIFFLTLRFAYCKLKTVSPCQSRRQAT